MWRRRHAFVDTVDKDDVSQVNLVLSHDDHLKRYGDKKESDDNIESGLNASSNYRC